MLGAFFLCRYLELSVWELQEQATELESTMEKISDEMHELRNELHENNRKWF